MKKLAMVFPGQGSQSVGMLAELAKYAPEEVDYVELNPDVAEIQFRHGLLQRGPGLRIVH